MSVRGGNIYFHYLVSTFYFPRRTQKKEFIKKIFKEHKVSLNTANFIFCSDEYLRSINKKYLSHNYRTDIITFDLSVDKAIIADVFISVDRAKSNALFYKVSTTSELLRLLIHGTLHLCGYDDKTTADFNQMKKLEEKYLKSFHVKL